MRAKAIETVLLTIDRELRFTLFGLENALGVEFDVAAVEQVFMHEVEHGSADGNYILYESLRVRVLAYVEEYEPETVWLTVENLKGDEVKAADIAERAHYQILRMEQFEKLYPNY